MVGGVGPQIDPEGAQARSQVVGDEEEISAMGAGRPLPMIEHAARRIVRAAGIQRRPGIHQARKAIVEWGQHGGVLFRITLHVEVTTEHRRRRSFDTGIGAVVGRRTGMQRLLDDLGMQLAEAIDLGAAMGQGVVLQMGRYHPPLDDRTVTSVAWRGMCRTPGAAGCGRWWRKTLRIGSRVSTMFPNR